MNHTERPWLDASKSVDERVGLLLATMTIEEKVAQMTQLSYSIITPEEADGWAKRGAGSFLHTLGNNARRIQRLATETRLGIPILFGIDAIHGHAIHNGATVFPTQLAMAASWDPDTAEKIGEATAKEVAAEGLHWTFSPVFCLGRDLRWGRIDETFGEDPYLSGKMGAGIIRGYQGRTPGDVKSPDRIVACAKHYIAYGESTGGRDSYDSAVTMRQIRSTFLPPFAEAVRAGCLTVMAGYEPVDSIPCSANKKLLQTILKDELGFDGFVVTDWMNVLSLHSRHKMAADLKEASRLALEAGNDMIMTTPEFYESTLALLREGKADVALVDAAVRRILKIKFLSGLFDVPEKVKTLEIESDPDTAKSNAVFGCAAHQKINLEAAKKSIVLLKNGIVGGAPVLPVRGPKAEANRAAPAESGERIEGRIVKTIAVIGPNADSVRAQFGDWTFFTHPTPHLDSLPTFRVTTMLDGIRAAAGAEGSKVLFDKGCDIFDPANNTIARACKIASKADIVFACIGDTLIQTGEAHDRANLALSGAQDELVEALRRVCDKKKIPLVSIFVNGKPLEFARAANASDAILETFNSGTLGGEAAADIIFGKANPQGRLPISFPRTTGQLPVYYNQIPGWHEGKYYDCETTPLFAFGEGLGYSTFRYDGVTLSKARARAGETVEVIVTVTNEGKHDGVETVQVYAADRLASIVTPVQELKAFAQVSIRAGETATVRIPLPVDSLSIVTPDEKTVLEPGEFEIRAGHDSRAGSLIATTLTVE
jgi:beta-glucosidase